MNNSLRISLVLSMLAIGAVGAGQAQAAAGDLDPRFGNEGRVVRKDLSPVRDLVVQRDRKTVLLGTSGAGANTSLWVARLRANGRLDRDFATNGTLELAVPGDETPGGMAIDDKGRIVVAYTSRPSEAEPVYGIARIRRNGNLDRSLDGNGLQTAGFGTGQEVAGAADVAVASDGAIVVAGTVLNTDGFHYDFGVVRFTKAGALDSSFSGDGREVTDFHEGEFRDDRATAVTVDSEGRVVAVGSTNLPGSGVDPIAVARYDAAGELDDSLAGDGTLVSDLAPEATDVVTLPDGRIAVSGGTASDFLVARFLADGTPDGGFSGDGAQTIDFDDGADEARALVRDGAKLVVAGSARSRRRGTDFAVAILKANGELDRKFGTMGHKQVDFARHRDEANAVAVDRTGDVVLGGLVDVSRGERAGVARLQDRRGR
jgi:uncharacterized delta-60 repeat protein